MKQVIHQFMVVCVWVPLYFWLPNAVFAMDIRFVKESAQFNPNEIIELLVLDTGLLTEKEQVWVGIFSKDSKGSSKPDSWQYLREVQDNKLFFKAPKVVGAYQFRFFVGKKKPLQHPSLNLMVKTIDKHSFKLSLHKLEYLPRETIPLTLNSDVDIPPSAWIGVFLAEQPHGVTKGYVDYKNIKKDRDRELMFRAPEKSGEYHMRFFDGYPGNEVDHITFKVSDLTENTSLSISTFDLDPEVEINIHYQGHKNFLYTAWIGMFNLQEDEMGSSLNKSDEPFFYALDKKRLSTVSGSVRMVAPSIKGRYEIRMYSSQNGSVVQSLTFKVKRSINANLLKEILDEKGLIRVYGIYFDHDSSDIKAESEPAIEAIRSMLIKFPELNIEVQGHTDNTGNAQHNIQLSEERAQNIKKALLNDESIHPNRISAKGYGESRPVKSNKGDVQRGLNRRVEIIRR